MQFDNRLLVLWPVLHFGFASAAGAGILRLASWYTLAHSHSLLRWPPHQHWEVVCGFQLASSSHLLVHGRLCRRQAMNQAVSR